MIFSVAVSCGRYSFLIRRIYSDGRHCLQPFKLAECWFDHLSCAGIIYQLFSPISPLPRILHTTQKQPFIMAHLNTYNLQHYKLKNFTVSQPCDDQNGAESQMLIWFQSNICVFNTEHLPLINWFWHWYNFIYRGRGGRRRREPNII